MSHKITKRSGIATLVLAGVSTAIALSVPAHAQSVTSTDASLAAETLSDGRVNQAIADLKAELRRYPGDPALLINLGIAQAQSGLTADARTSFETALRSRDVVELETADGRSTDSRRLARQAIGMLDRGEFQPAANRQFTLRNR